jgi:hypothetical protein
MSRELREYLKARERHAESERLMLEAEDRMDRLLPLMGDRRAYREAGVRYSESLTLHLAMR